MQKWLDTYNGKEENALHPQPYFIHQSLRYQKPTSWSYLYLQHKAAKTLQKWLDTYNGKEENALHPQPYFIHQSLRYQYGDKENECRVKKTLEPTVCGLVFLQGTVKGLQEFLKQNFPNYHLVNDRCKARPASIEDAVMQKACRSF